MAATKITKLFGGGPNNNFVNRYQLERDDGHIFDNSNGLSTGLLELNVSNGLALTGFSPPVGYNSSPPYASLPGVGSSWTPDGTQVVVRGYTTSAGAQTAIVGSVVLDEASFLRDTDDATGMSVKCKLYPTVACFSKIIIEVPH